MRSPLLLLGVTLALSACTQDAEPAPPPSAGLPPALAQEATLLRGAVDRLAERAAPTERTVEDDTSTPCGPPVGGLTPAAHHYTLRLRLSASDSLPTAARLVADLEAEGWVRVESPARPSRPNPVSLRRDRLRITVSGEIAPSGEDAALGLRGDTECVGAQRASS